MNKYNFYLTIVILFNCFIYNVLAENHYYIISIRRNSEDEEYDKASEKIKNAIEELVNNRMNNIYDIINENKETYITKDGKLDEKLNELTENSQLKKRNEKKKIKFQFINRNRPQRYNSQSKLNSLSKREEEYIPIESNLVISVCPVLNYYVVVAYLSDDLIEKIEKLPNVISCKKSKTLKNRHSINYKRLENAATKYYNKEEILNETHWKDLGVQEHELDFTLRNTHLSIISQDKYNGNSKIPYDNNYYYPSSAGKGIDIYVIDDGIDTSFSEENFDTYEGTPDERIIQCDGIFENGQYHPVTDKKNCNIKSKFMDIVNHGTYVSISALGSLNGVAKKANLHMLATYYEDYDQLSALDYIKQNAIPHKTVVNISRGCGEFYNCYSQELQDKITELVNMGVIVFVALGNTGDNNCMSQSYNTGIIFIGAINNEKLHENSSDFENMYEIADYSSYGECIDLFSPGTIRVTNRSDEIMYIESGTSFASPMVAGLASTLMSDSPEIKYDFELMKKKLIDLSIKDVIQGLDENTPNRLVNNGKRSIYGPMSCSDPSGLNKCKDGCCSKYGFCVNQNSEDSNLQALCLIENGCQSEFGYCTTNKCGKDNNMRKCHEDECCSIEGNCIKIENDNDGFCFIENGCLNDFSGQCLSSDLNNIDSFDEKYHKIIFNYNCKNELKPFIEGCDINDSLYHRTSFNKNEHSKICNPYQKLQCQEFFKSPFTYAPSCEKAKDILESNMPEALEISQNNLFCAKKNSRVSSDFCVNTFDQYDSLLYDTSEVDVKPYCQYKNCRESLLQYIQAVYDNEMAYKERGEKVYEDEIEVYRNDISYLSSNQCTKY